MYISSVTGEIFENVWKVLRTAWWGYHRGCFRRWTLKECVEYIITWEAVA